MSEKLNKENIIKTLDNGIGIFEREKTNFKNNLKDLNGYLSDYFVNLPSQTNGLKSLISTNEQKINENFDIIIGLLKNIRNRVSNLFSNIFINIDLPDFRNKLSYSMQTANNIVFAVGKIKSDIEEYKTNNPEIKPTNTLLTMPIHFDKTYSQTVSILEEILTNTSITIQYLKNVLDHLKEIEKKVSDYSNIDYKKRFEEDTNLLLKQFENQISNLIKTYENQIKIFNLEIKDSTDTVKIAKENLADIELKNSDLSSKLSGYERRLQQITDSRSEDIQYVLEEKLVELERINNDKISVIDKSYEKAQTNYQKFKDLVEKAGVYDLIVNYKDKAEEEKKEYKTYRKYTSTALYWAIGFTIFILGIPLVEHWFSTKPITIDYYSILVRLSISLMFLVLALFFSKQASKHYECYQENNRTFLQLAALEPFMANMSPEDQLAIRKQLVPTYFNQNADGKFASKGDEVDISTNMHNLLSQVISVVAEKKDPKPSTNSSESNTTAK